MSAHVRVGHRGRSTRPQCGTQRNSAEGAQNGRKGHRSRGSIPSHLGLYWGRLRLNEDSCGYVRDDHIPFKHHIAMSENTRSLGEHTHQRQGQRGLSDGGQGGCSRRGHCERCDILDPCTEPREYQGEEMRDNLQDQRAIAVVAVQIGGERVRLQNFGEERTQRRIVDVATDCGLEQPVPHRPEEAEKSRQEECRRQKQKESR